MDHDVSLNSCLKDWEDLEKDYKQLEVDHEMYSKQLEEMLSLQKKCLSGIAHQRYQMKSLVENMKMLNVKDEEGQNKLRDLKTKMNERKGQFRDLEDNLPHKNGLYLSIILGQVNISLLNKADKFAYKADYERFKVTVSYITLALSIIIFLISDQRWLDATLHFLLVWYYCTLTIRENILIVNGSRIKGWWITHHFISTVAAGITLIWPDGETYQSFRAQYAIFSLYLSCMYVLQYFYQKGSLYRLRALGQGHEMDITAEGFMSWMWKGLAFLLPFLFIGYIFQMYNAYVLYHLSKRPGSEWQVKALTALHFILSVGNITTTLKVVQQKLSTQLSNIKQQITTKYKFNSKTKLS